MSSDDVVPLPSDVAEIVASARRITGPASDVRDRMRARLVATLPAGPGGGGDGGGGGGASGATPSPWARAPWWTVAAALVVGVSVGRLMAPSAETRVDRDAALATPSSSAHAMVSAMIPAVTSPSDLPNAAPPPAPSAGDRVVAGAIASVGSAKSTGNMAAERRLLDVARTALGRGNGADALAACDEHARKFPSGLLAEEREAIAVQALVEAKRIPEARARSDRFRQSYPKSILLPAVAAAVAGEP